MYTFLGVALYDEQNGVRKLNASEYFNRLLTLESTDRMMYTIVYIEPYQLND